MNKKLSFQLKNHSSATSWLCAIVFFVFAQSLNAQVNFSQRAEHTVKGDLIMLANNIVSLDRKNINPNDDYNGGDNNSYTNLDYIDIDSDSNTFSSSSSDLADLGSCSQIIYAGLYWAAVYDDGLTDFTDIKFKVPGGAYVNITPTTTPYNTQTIYDNNGSGNPEGSFYACYADVTSLVAPLANPAGTYTVANIRAYTGNTSSLGTAGGWILVVVYEDPGQARKYISSYDGFAKIESGDPPVNFGYNGFSTIPIGPVNARLGVGALEGDQSITGDQLQIENTSGVYQNLSTPNLNNSTNFFNSTISYDDNYVTTRNPKSENTLGFDADLFSINNPGNNLIGNNQTSANFQLTTNGDTYAVFLNTLAVEIIEPEFQVTKRVLDSTGTDITGQSVTLGQTLFYELKVQNIGNDDAINAYILDDLPANVNFIPGNVTITPPGNVTTTYDSAIHQVRFDIDPSIIEVGDAPFFIRFKVQVASNCNDLRDACENAIANISTSYYEGEINNDVTSGEPSYYGIDSCNLGVAGSTNFIANLGTCNFTRTEHICNTLQLTAGAGYDSYEWTEQGSPTVIGTTQTITVTAPGVYICNGFSSSCADIQETVTVLPLFNIANPLLPYADNVQTCSIDGTEVVEIYLCGASDSQLISTGIANGNVIWEELDQSSCPVSSPDCPNLDSSCVWNQLSTSSSFTVSNAGQYRVIITDNGCTRTFYFNVFKNLLDPQLVLIDPIVCGNPGSIEVVNVPTSGYEFSLNAAGPWQPSTVFNNLSAEGTYTVYIREENGLPGACVFTTSIFVDEYTLVVNTSVTDIICQGTQGSINVQVTDALPGYSFQLTGFSTISTNQPNYTYTNLNAGTYTLSVTSNDGACVYSETITIQPPAPFTATATLITPLSCQNAEIDVTTNLSDTSSLSFSLDPNFSPFINASGLPFQITQPGTYIVYVSNQTTGCVTQTNPIIVEPYTPLSIALTAIPANCTGGFGQIDVAVTGGEPNYNYDLNGTQNFNDPATAFTFNNVSAGTHTITVTDAYGCVVTATTTLTDPLPISATLALTQSYTCTTSSATLEVQNTTGGTPPYTYDIGNGPQTSPTFPGLSDGTYTVTVTDANGCPFTTNSVVVEPLNPPSSLFFSATDVSCTSGLTSDVTVSVTGGNPPFTYEVTAPSPINNGNNSTFTGLPVGTHTFLVTDAKGCTVQGDYTVNPISQLSLSGNVTANVSCQGASDGALSVSINGGSGNYSYTVNGGAATPTTNTAIVLTNLPAGTYTIDVTDTGLGCSGSISLTIDEPATALALTFSESPITCLADGGLSATASGGWGTYSYTLTLPDGSTTGPQASGTFTALSQTGGYTIEVTDANGCSASQTFSLSAPVSPTIAIDPTTDLCIGASGATIVATATGGVPPYSYTLNGGTPQTSGTFSGLPAGSYTVVVTDSYGCSDGAASATVVVEPALSATLSLLKALDCTASPDAQIQVAIAGGYPPYSLQPHFNGAPLGGTIAVTGNSHTFAATTAGDYHFTVTDGQGCAFTTPVITILPAPVPTFTANVTDVLCQGESNGVLEVLIDPSSGNSPFVVSIDGGATFSPQTLYPNLTAGSYTVIVQGAGECQS
ncbi:MAG TPA: hypothetical protein VFM65_07950, partial [Flavobacteriaceae bacterium]|nr:hypothetical protein [Flavobacteriaceae bacterium]